MLGDDSHVPPQVVYVDVGEFGRAYRDETRVGLVQPLEKGHDSGFSTTGWAHECDAFAWIDSECDVLEDRDVLAFGVREGDVVKRYGAGNGGRRVP